MENKKFEDYSFRPSAVIAGLNQWYEHGGFKFFSIEFPESKEGDRKYHVFRTNPMSAIDDAIKYLRSMDIFYTPGMKWDDVKFKLNSKACNAEYGFCDVRDAWLKVNPAIDQRKRRDSEIRDYILERVDANGIEIPIVFRTAAVENLMAYLLDLLTQEREDKKLIARENGIRVTERENMIRKYILTHAEDEHISVPKSLKDQRVSVENLIAYLFALLIQERKNKELAEEIQDRYCEKNAKLQKELDQWDRWFERQTKFMQEERRMNNCAL